MGLKSGLYGGRNRIAAPARSIAQRTSGCLWTARLSSDDVADAQAGHQDLLDIGEKARVVDRTVEDRGRAQPVESQGGDHGVCVPMPERGMIPETRAARTASDRKSVV